RAAEHRVASANATIGQAMAGYFPRVSIVGQIGQASLAAGRLAYDGSSLWSIGPSIHVPLFELSATHALVLEKEARTREAVASYRDAVLRAFGEVADAMSGLGAHAEVRE